MSHIRSVSGERSVWSACGISPALTPGTSLSDLIYDLYTAFTQFVYRKKFEPITGT